MIEWSFDGDKPRELVSISEPVSFVRVLRSSGSLVIGGASGAVWLWASNQMSQIGKETAGITAVVVSRDSRWLAIGTSQSAVHVYDLASHQIHNIKIDDYAGGSMSFSAESSMMALAMAKTVSLVQLSDLKDEQSLPVGLHSDTTPWSWSHIEVSAQHVAFSPDGRWFAITCDHGGIWFNQKGSDRWLYISTGPSKITEGYFSPDSLQFIAKDVGGRALAVDVTAKLFGQPNSILE